MLRYAKSILITNCLSNYIMNTNITDTWLENDFYNDPTALNPCTIANLHKIKRHLIRLYRIKL